MPEFIYQMHQARKAHGDKVILDDVTLSFYPGAKIGVVGPNGMGKSTLLKIMAGLEEVTNGEARLTPGYSCLLYTSRRLNLLTHVILREKHALHTLKHFADKYPL